MLLSLSLFCFYNETGSWSSDGLEKTNKQKKTYISHHSLAKNVISLNHISLSVHWVLTLTNITRLELQLLKFSMNGNQ